MPDPARRTCRRSARPRRPGRSSITFASDPQGDGRGRLPRLRRPDPEVRRRGRRRSGSSTSSVTRAATSCSSAVPPARPSRSQEFEGAKEVLADEPADHPADPRARRHQLGPGAGPAGDGRSAGAGTTRSTRSSPTTAQSAAGVIRAYEAAGHPLPLITTTDDNSLSCGFDALKAKPTPPTSWRRCRRAPGSVVSRCARRSAPVPGQEQPRAVDLRARAVRGLDRATPRGDRARVRPASPDAPSDATPSTLLTSDEIAELFS